jgi:hypothetical protein
MSTRLEKLIAYAAAGGVLSDFVEQKLSGNKPKSNFKDLYLQAKNVNDRQALILQYATKPTKLHPITLNLPDGSKIVYEVMPNYLTIDGLMVSVTAETAQKLAKKWNMVLPTAKMVEQIFQEASQKGGAISPTPLSSSGYTDPVTGQYYSAEEVVKHRINDPGANIAYNERVNKEIQKKPNAPIYSGHGKTIIQPLDDDSGKISFYGIPREENGKIRWVQPASSAHGKSARETHEEYITSMQAASDKAVIISPDGSKKEVSLVELMKDPNLYKYINDKPQVKEYKVRTT